MSSGDGPGRVKNVAGGLTGVVGGLRREERMVDVNGVAFWCETPRRVRRDERRMSGRREVRKGESRMVS